MISEPRADSRSIEDVGSATEEDSKRTSWVHTLSPEWYREKIIRRCTLTLEESS